MVLLQQGLLDQVISDAPSHLSHSVITRESKAHRGTLPTAPEERDLYWYVERESIFSLKGVWSKTFSVQEGIIGKEEGINKNIQELNKKGRQ